MKTRELTLKLRKWMDDCNGEGAWKPYIGSQLEGDVVRFIQNQALSMSGVIDSGEWDSTRLIGKVRDRYDQIQEEGKGEWEGFYNGWLEGRIEMLAEIKGSKPDR